MTNEIISLQFGNYSNYVGAHFWNIQESNFVYSGGDSSVKVPDINHDVLFREGINNQNRITFTPRMVLYDLKENINVFRNADGVKKVQEDKDSDLFTWSSGETEIIREDEIKTSEYINDLDKTEIEQLEAELKKKQNIDKINYLQNDYDMEKQVNYWTDFLKMKYHDRSYNTLSQFQSSDKDNDDFELHHYGLNAVKEKNNFMDNFEDKLRHFSEECDHMQGFQLIIDSYNGFGGMASGRCFELLNEEYRKKNILAILAFPFFENQKKESKTMRLINTSFTLKNLLQDNSDIMCLPISCDNSFLMSNKSDPINLPFVNYQPSLNYHTSAILGSLIDSVTLPWRQKSQKTTMNNTFELFDTYKYKMVSLQSVYPLRMNDDKYMMNYLQDKDLCKSASWFTPLSSTYNAEKTLEGSFSVCCSGVDDERVKNVKDKFAFSGSIPANVLLDQYFEDMYPKSKSKSYSIRTGLCTKLPFPNIMKDITLRSDTSKVLKSKTSELITILQMNKSILPMLDSIQSNIKKCKINEYSKYFDNGMEYDDFQELKNFTEDLKNSFSD